MKTQRIMGMAWESMKQRKLRTSLTTLGVVIGITAIISLASLGEGFRLDVKQQLQSGFELNNLTVIPGSLFAGYSRTGFSDQQLDDVAAIPGVEVATGVMQIGNVTLYNGNKTVTAFVATAVNFTDFVKIFQDRFIFESGNAPENNSDDAIVIGYKVNHSGDNSSAFAEAGDYVTVAMNVPQLPTGFTVQNQTFRVSGTLQRRGTSGITNFDYWVFLPLKTVREMYHINQSDLIFVKVKDQQESEAIADKIENHLGHFKVTVLVPLAFIKQVDNILNIVQIFLLAVAAISLIVAGIGIMNITMVSVMERTREIGILKAIGAKDRTVLGIFLSEALITGIIGGVIGIITGYGLSYTLAYVLSSMIHTQQTNIILQTPETHQTLAVTPVFSPEWTAVAFVFAIAVSVIFGLYPARKAAKLDPVQALRYE
jgi:putative ABC transport system permease protein